MRSGIETADLEGGLCHDLPLAVVDKYFMANGISRRFEYLTAQAICANCPIQESCLADAISNPTREGVRGGESAVSVRALNYQHRRERTPVRELARTALRHQVPLQGRPWGRPSLLAGKFESPELAFPELGGEL